MIPRVPLDSAAVPGLVAAMQGSLYLLVGAGSFFRRRDPAGAARSNWFGAPMLIVGLALVLGSGTGPADRNLLGVGSAGFFLLLLAALPSSGPSNRLLALVLAAFFALWLWIPTV